MESLWGALWGLVVAFLWCVCCDVAQELLLWECIEVLLFRVLSVLFVAAGDCDRALAYISFLID